MRAIITICLLLMVDLCFSFTFNMVPQTSTITVDTIYERLKWVENSNPTFMVNTDGTDGVAVRIRMNQLYSTVYNLRAEVLSKNSLGIYVDPYSVTNSSDGTYTWITLKYPYTELITRGDQYGCVNTGSVGSFTKYQCSSVLNFWGTEVSRILRKINYNFLFFVNKYTTGEVITSAQEELMNIGDINFTTAVTATMNIYLADCVTSVPGNILTYRENYCVKAVSANSVGNNYYFKPYSFNMTFKSQDGSDIPVDILSRATCSYGSGSEKAIAQCNIIY
jgi:hypothetical protein